MKLKHLFPNTDLAEMLVKYWNYDDTDLFKYWRISANAVFPFKNEDKVYILRFAPEDEKLREDVIAELDFIKYLKANGYKSIEVEPSKDKRELVEANTPWGKYYAAVFPRVSGDSLGDTDITNDIARLWGKALGKLHILSENYTSGVNKCWGWKEQMSWILKTLREFPGETKALCEAELLDSFFETVPITKQNYGMIHYDFELDNVFYDEVSNSIIPIDFDDCMYNWFAIDIETTLSSIDEELDKEKAENVKKYFLEGYQQEKEISEEMFKLLPVFHRFHELYSYVRVLVSAWEKWENEPEWMLGLREKLNRIQEIRAKEFGNEINIKQ